MTFFEKTEFWEMSKRHFWKKIQATFSAIIVAGFFPRMTLTQFPKKYFSKIYDPTQEKSLDFFSAKTLTHFPVFGFFIKIRG